MKNLVEMRRKHTKWNIEQNPSYITIKRTEKKKMDGHIGETESTAGPFVVRIFVSNSNTVQKVMTLAGEKQVDRYFGLLADYEADIRAGTTVKDEFEAMGMKFLVKAIYPQTIHGQIVGYQGELERVM
ncbi:hypothetical protein NCCP2222_01890 [Sporosarcina sp. NCCP-2222]|uniref:hypothetical protein n=1 Tax=Sporosarcina sp. NCCP-2222 TaxID=2935073 RepID=UPI00208C7EB1|nr:hypothetical protein [Sporosarcina sp. NCCP-2222]GKV54242.1 hypothetical protein NCCP2222_01890 [Sporosarcina sp. NCCP-2222]